MRSSVRRWLRNLVSVAALLSLSACRSKSSVAPAPVSSSAAQLARADGGGDGAVANAARAARPAASVAQNAPPTAEQVAAQKRFEAALGRGRTLSGKGDYANAIRALDEAVRIDPESPIALSERGFARLKSGALDEALADLEAAEKRASTKTLRAQVAFNRGLVLERQGTMDLAERAFARSYALHHTDAAKARMGKVSACPIVFSPDDSIEILTWMQAHGQVTRDFDDGWPGKRTVRSNAEARENICYHASGSSQSPPELGGDCDDQDPWRVTTTHGFFADNTFFVWPLDAKNVGFSNVGMIGGTMCSMGQDTSTYEAGGDRQGNFLIVTTTTTHYRWKAEDDGGGAGDCIEDEVIVSHSVYDVSRKIGVNYNDADGETVDLDPEHHRIVVKGEFCSERYDLKSPRPSVVAAPDAR
jgi:hypothetical protein